MEQMARTKHDSIAHTVVSLVAAGGTFTVAYPFGKTADVYVGGTDHLIVSHSMRTLRALSGDFSLTFGASNITVTLGTNVVMPAGTVIYLNVDRSGEESDENVAAPLRMSRLELVRCIFGAIATAVANGVCASQSLLASGIGTINGSLATALVATFATPRNVVAAWTNTAVITVTGTDEYGNVMRESSGSGTSFTGKKAFKTVTRVTVSADVTGLTVGSGVVIGLPMFLADAPDVIRELVDAAVPTAGTIVAGDQTTPSATTGDVRGTISFNLAPNGTRIYELTAWVRSALYKGLTNFAG